MTQREQADLIFGRLTEFFSNRSLVELHREGRRLSTTSPVKSFLGNLGHELGYLVAARGFQPANEGEWLYDMVWYELTDGFLHTSVPTA